MDGLLRDFRIAIRTLARQRTFSLVAILTLALGVGATTAIFSVVYGILLRPLPYVESDRLVTLGQTARSDPQEPVDGSSSHVNFLDWQRSSKTIPSMALYSGGRAVISNQGEADVVRDRQRHAGLLRRVPRDSDLGARIHGGRESTDWPARDRRQLRLLAGPAWRARPDVLSQTVEISGVPWPIVGVAPRGFDFPNGARLWMPVRNNDEQCGRGCVYLNGIGRLADGATRRGGAGGDDGRRCRARARFSRRQRQRHGHGAEPSRSHGRQRPAGARRVARRRHDGAADRVRERRQSLAGPWRGAPQRDRGSNGSRRGPSRAACPIC